MVAWGSVESEQAKTEKLLTIQQHDNEVGVQPVKIKGKK